MIDTQGETSVPGLFAAGEVTSGLHGANRLGGNALTETRGFGARAGEAAAAWAKDSSGDHQSPLSLDMDIMDIILGIGKDNVQRPSG